MIRTPVALIIFNRPDTTERVFQAIRQAQPQKLLVIADGPRIDRPNEAEKCAASRAVIAKVDWECEVLTNYSPINLGCKLRVSSGIDWVFSEVEEAIILEDDCLPAPSFFPFCQALLERYRYDERIMQISGNNFLQDRFNIKLKESYYFSKYGGIWGWASWRRAWKFFDVKMENWNELKMSDLLPSIFDSAAEQNSWTDVFDKVVAGVVDTWDYQWLYARWCQNHLSIVPKSNLVSNIGFRKDATHTKCKTSVSNLEVEDIWHITHPNSMIRNREADCYLFDTHYRSQPQPVTSAWLNKLKQGLLNHI